ncbi:MAG: hypothetical protein HXS44_12940 [Theionarchaea archaeon]|nr:hypothetical protein [Theionarchaea archaeon]
MNFEFERSTIRKIGKIGSVPLILIGIVFAFLLFVWTVSMYGLLIWIVLLLFFEIPLLFMILGVWSPDPERVNVARGKTSSILWIFTIGFTYLVIRFIKGFSSYVDSNLPTMWFSIFFAIMVVSSIAVIVSLWMPEERNSH